MDADPIDPPNHYSNGGLDRAAALREDEAWQAQAATSDAARYVLFAEGEPLIEPGPAPRAALRPYAGQAPDLFLGLDGGVPLFACDVSGRAVETRGAAFTAMRGLAALLPPLDATILATARGMFNWHATHAFCPRCAGGLRKIRAGWVLQCGACGREQFPRTDAAVIMLVARGDRLLLGQSQKWPVERNMYSTLAGFVEPGESLEDAVRREVMEEVGVRIGAVAYHSSQPWPFPASLMLGFAAQALSEEIVLEEAEMRDARWFTRAQLRDPAAHGFALPSHDSIARRLIEDWLAAPA